MIFTVPFLSSNKHIVQMNVMINIVQSLIACISHWCCLAEIYLQVLCNFPVDKSLHPLKLLASTFGLAHSECVFFYSWSWGHTAIKYWVISLNAAFFSNGFVCIAVWNSRMPVTDLCRLRTRCSFFILDLRAWLRRSGPPQIDDVWL